MPLVLGYAVDLSNFSGIPLLAIALLLRTLGFTRAILSAYDADIFAKQYDVLTGVGFEVDAYGYLNFPGGKYHLGRSATTQMQRYLANLGGRVVRRMWIDCEDEIAFKLAAADNLAFILEAANACAGVVYSGIYTRRDWWVSCTGDSTAFAMFELWDCTADGTPDLGRADYGGWAVPYMEQYAFDQPVSAEGETITADFNCYGAGLAAVVAEDVTASTHAELQLSVTGIEVAGALAARGLNDFKVESVTHDDHRTSIVISGPYPLPVGSAFAGGGSN